MVYTDYPEAELFLNGKSMGRRRKLSLSEVQSMKGDSLALLRHYRLIWDSVRYEPGKLVVVAYDKEGHPAMSDSVCTAGQPYRLVATVDKHSVCANGTEYAFVQLKVVDRQGNLCPDSSERIRFRVDGCGEFVASANGDPTDLNPFHISEMPVFHGQLMAIVRGNGSVGEFFFEASADGLLPCKIKIKTK